MPEAPRLRADLAVVRLLGTRDRRVRIFSLTLVLVAGLGIRLAFINAPGNVDDLNLFFTWFKAALSFPPSEIYARASVNYPPAALVIFELTARVFSWFARGEPSDDAMRIAVKLPAIIVDIVGAATAYAIVCRFGSHAKGLGAAAFVAFNPAIVYVSAYWGQIDSIPTILALLAVFVLLFGWGICAWIVLAFAALIKPPVLVLAPLFLIYPFTTEPGPQRRRRLWAAGLGIVAALTLSEVLALVYFPHSSVFAAARSLVVKLYTGSSRFPFNSLNAFNLWALFADFFVPDKTRFLLVPLRFWGYLSYLAAMVLVCRCYARRRTKLALLEAATILFLGFFVLLTQMHERYLYYAVVFISVLIFRRPYGYAAAILSVTMILNLEYGMTYMSLDDAKVAFVNANEFAPWLVHLCALANLGVFAWLLWCFRCSPVGEAKPQFNPTTV